MQPSLPGAMLWRDFRFITLAAGMSLGLFAQIGLVAHLFSLMAPSVGAQQAGMAMALVTASAMGGRALLGWTMPTHADRRLVAGAGYIVQIAGSIALLFSAGTDIPLLLLGLVLFGAGFGNATLLPPLIAQVEFAKDDVPRVVALIFALAQGAFAFAPAVFGCIQDSASHWAYQAIGAPPHLFIVAACVQALAICAFLAGRQTRQAALSPRAIN